MPLWFKKNLWRLPIRAAKPKPMFRLELAPHYDRVPATVRLGKALIELRKRFGLECVKLEDLEAGCGCLGPAVREVRPVQREFNFCR